MANGNRRHEFNRARGRMFHENTTDDLPERTTAILFLQECRAGRSEWSVRSWPMEIDDMSLTERGEECSMKIQPMIFLNERPRFFFCKNVARADRSGPLGHGQWKSTT